MKLRRHPITLLLLLFTLFASCSVQKNTKSTRLYHAFTTRYNVMYHARTHFQEQLKSMEESYEDNYAQLIHMHPASAYAFPKETQPSGNFERTIEKCQRAIRTHSISTKPSRERSKMSDPTYKAFTQREEFNPYLHHAWLLMGEAQFYSGDFLSASATFAYTARHFAWLPEVVANAQIWLARCYLEMDWLYEAEEVLQKINNDKLPPSQTEWLATVQAAYHLKKGEYEESIPLLKRAIAREDGRAERIRMTFLLAQLYAKTGNTALAYDTYQEVINQNPSYRTEFNARINQTEVYSQNDTTKIAKKLRHMARDSKNKEYLDQVYYALGNVYLHQQDTVRAIEYYQLAASKSTRMGVERAISQIELGNLFYHQQLYTKAQPCYAEAIPLLDETFPNFDLLSKRSTVLDELVVYAENVELQDSLQGVANLPEEDRKALIEKKIKEYLRAEREAKKEQEQQERQSGALSLPSGMSGMGGNRPGMAPKPVITQPMNTGDDSWYFYNKSLVTAGKINFQQTWGNRKLEDNWRRSNKSTFSMSDFDTPTPNEEGESESEEQTNKEEEKPQLAEVDDPRKEAYYLTQLPLTAEAMEASDQIIMEGLYNVALILKNKLGDFPAAIASFERLLKEYPQSKDILESYYNLYLIYMQLDEPHLAEEFRQRILKQFPTSSYALAMADKNYLERLRSMESQQDSIYLLTYAAFLEDENRVVHENFQYMEQHYPLSRLMPKFLFLHALAFVGERENENFQQVLRRLLEQYPESDVSPLASAMLKGVTEGREVNASGGKIGDRVWDTRLSSLTGDSTTVASDSTTFIHEQIAPHLLVLAYATHEVASNQLLFQVAKHNFTRYMIKDFDLEIISFNEISLLLVKGFNTFDQVNEYYTMLNDATQGITLPEGVRTLLISEENFNKLLSGHSIEEYQEFQQGVLTPSTSEP